MLGCDRQLFVPLPTESGLLDALNARLPPALEPLASWTMTGKIKLPDVDVRRQHLWSARLTHVKAASLIQAAAGRDVPRLVAQRPGKARGWLSPPPSVAGQGLCLAGANYSKLLKWHLGVPLLPADCAGRPLCAPCVEGRWTSSATTPCHARSRAYGIGTLALNLISARSLPKPPDILLKGWDGRRDLAVDLTMVHPNPATGRPVAVPPRSSGTRGNKRIGRAPTRAGGCVWTSPRWCSTPGEASTRVGRKWRGQSSQDAEPRGHTTDAAWASHTGAGAKPRAGRQPMEPATIEGGTTHLKFHWVVEP